MSNKMKQICTNILSSLITCAAYGLILYFVFSWLAGYSLLHAYIGNLVLIASVLAIDEYVIRALQSEKFAAQAKKQKDPEKYYRTLQRALGSVGSFKADLYLFYVFVLIFSQIIEINPALAGENVGDFVLANSYSILILIALDTLIGQFSRDRTRTKRILAKLKDSITEIRD